MGNFHLTDLVGLWNETWLVLLIGFGTAGLAFVVGWTTLRRRKAPASAPAASGIPIIAGGDPFTSGPANERRASARRGGHPVTVELTGPDDKQPSQQGWVLNRSVGGLCLMVPQPVPVGSQWKVRPCEAPRTTPQVPVEVRTCVAAGAEWKLSCRFEKTPSYAILLLFG